MFFKYSSFNTPLSLLFFQHASFNAPLPLLFFQRSSFNTLFSMLFFQCSSSIALFSMLFQRYSSIAPAFSLCPGRPKVNEIFDCHIRFLSSCHSALSAPMQPAPPKNLISSASSSISVAGAGVKPLRLWRTEIHPLPEFHKSPYGWHFVSEAPSADPGKGFLPCWRNNMRLWKT